MSKYNDDPSKKDKPQNCHLSNFSANVPVSNKSNNRSTICNTYSLVLRVHITKSKIVFFSQIQKLTNMIDKILTFGIFL